MTDATNFPRPESSQDEYCLDDIFESLRRDREEMERENLERANKKRESAGHENSSREISASDVANSSATNREFAVEAQSPASSLQDSSESLRNEPPSDRRKRRRALISAPVRVRGINVTDAVVNEVSTTIDVSRAGILFLSSSPNYSRGMEVAVIFPFSTAPTALHAEQPGRIVRVFERRKASTPSLLRWAKALAKTSSIPADANSSRRLSPSRSTANERPRGRSCWSSTPTKPLAAR